MNPLHNELLATDEWRDNLVQHVLPFAFGNLSVADLGDDVLEVGPGPGLTTDLLHPNLHKVTSIEIDPELAAKLAARLEGTNVEVVAADATAMPFDDGRFSGAMTFTMFHHVPTVELQDQLMAEVARVLRPGGLLVANDSIASEQLAGFHEDDIYNPIDPTTLEARLARAGFVDIDVRVNPHAWACHARRPA
ncbi:MAG TPA: class I SAM-dependent methyltransferase [Ilumatobacteraceae bacterium]